MTRKTASMPRRRSSRRRACPRELHTVTRAASAARRARRHERRLRRVERDLVDNRFAALREVVTGHADGGAGTAPASAPVAAAGSGGNALQLGGILALLGEQYTRLSVAGAALAANSMPPAVDIGTMLQLEAEKLPAPFRAVLAGISVQVTQKVNAGVGTLLAGQLESSVGAACRRAIARQVSVRGGCEPGCGHRGLPPHLCGRWPAGRLFHPNACAERRYQFPAMALQGAQPRHAAHPRAEPGAVRTGRGHPRDILPRIGREADGVEGGCPGGQSRPRDPGTLARYRRPADPLCAWPGRDVPARMAGATRRGGGRHVGQPRRSGPTPRRS